MAGSSDYKNWTVDEVCQYLQDEGVGEWGDIFREKEIDGARLQNIPPEELKSRMKDGFQRLWGVIKKFRLKTESKIFNDSIHGHVELHPLLVRIIDTPQFQRLRYIKQLGGGYFVFPGASHNRFEHSIGVAYLAGQLAQNLRTKQPELNITDTDILCVQIAGLCHDLGHGPFSHLFDQAFIHKARPDLGWKHETASVKMFDYLVEDNGLETVMEQYGLQLPKDLVFVKEMITPERTSESADNWPYKGRPVDKSFLYEIVANKINGVDVDKFDYFARDCHHLGIQNNFDHRRFLMLVRVCEVKGRKHICVRDKEVGNMYDMFNTRITLHRRAYQHRVTKIIQTMVTEAFLMADEHIQVEGSGKRMFTLSEAIDDMEAYTKLTDCVFEQILNSSSSELAEAREILGKIVSRQLYPFLGQTKAVATEDMIPTWKDELAKALPQTGELQPADFEIQSLVLNYGKGDNNPVNSVYFYSKNDPTTAMHIDEETVSELRPRRFSETLIMVYCKKTKSVERAKRHFDQWCTVKGFQNGSTVGL